MKSRRSTGVLALGGLALIALGGGCTKHPPPPLAVDKLSIAEASLAACPALGLGPDGLQTAVRAAMKEQGVLLLKPHQPPPGKTKAYALRAEVGAAHLVEVPLPDGGVGQNATVELVLELSRRGHDGTLSILGTGTGRLPAPASREPDALGPVFHRAFEVAVRDAAASVIRSALANDRDTKQLIAELSSPDAGVREAAADVLVNRKERAAIPVLIDELGSPDDDVRMKAVGELVELRAHEAVPRLIDLAQGDAVDPHLQVQLIYAMGSIGGDEAEAYLYTIASGHPDELVRNAAKEAAAELQSNKNERIGAVTSGAPRSP